MRKEFTRLIVAIFCLFFGLTLFILVSCGGGDDSDTPPAPASFSGTWRGTGNSPQTGSMPTTLILSQSDNSVSGTWDGYAVTGTVSGNQLTLTFTPFTQSGVSYTGGGNATVSGNSMSGTMSLTGTLGSNSTIVNGTFTATRSSSEAAYNTDDAPAGGLVAAAVGAIAE